MNRSARIATCCAFVVTAIVGGLSAASPQTFELPSNEQVVGYLLQSVNWYRHVYAEQRVANGPAGLIFLDDNRSIELQIVKLSFEFAKADATVETTAPSPHDGPTRGSDAYWYLLTSHVDNMIRAHLGIFVSR